MNKVTRVLDLYRSLLNGKSVAKADSCARYKISPRSFDRDIHDIRLFLSEFFSDMELLFDEDRQSYYLKNLSGKRKIGIGETYILTKLLLDSYQLRTDDREEIVKIMLSQLSTSEKKRIIPVLRHSPKIVPCLSKASIKLVEDLLLSIERKDRISLQFGQQYRECSCVPYSIEIRNRYAFLIAWDIAQKEPRMYALDEILSYIPANFPYDLSGKEQSKLQELISIANHSEADTYQPFIYKKELIL